MTTATQTFSRLADLTPTALPPGLGRDGKPDPAGREARAGHTAQTLRQWARWGGDLPLQMSDLAYAYSVLGMRASEDGPTRSRRHTCRQLAALAEQSCGEYPGTRAEERAALERAIAVWEQVAGSCDPLDGRQTAIALRCAAEVETMRGPDGLAGL